MLLAVKVMFEIKIGYFINTFIGIICNRKKCKIDISGQLSVKLHSCNTYLLLSKQFYETDLCNCQLKISATQHFSLFIMRFMIGCEFETPDHEHSTPLHAMEGTISPSLHRRRGGGNENGFDKCTTKTNDFVTFSCKIVFFQKCHQII